MNSWLPHVCLLAHIRSNGDARINGVALTGSIEAGKRVAERAVESHKKSTMKLGGSDAFIVLGRR